MRSPSLTSTCPRATLLSPLTARSSVDLPEPDRPISTEISPSLTVRLASGAPSTAPVLAEDLGAVGAAIDHLKRARRVLAEDDVDMLEIDGDAHFLTSSRFYRKRAVEDDGEDDDGEARLDAERDVGLVERPATGLPRPSAPIRAAITTIDSDSMMHWVRPAMMSRQRRRQLDLPQELALGRAERLAGLDHAAWAPR